MKGHGFHKISRGPINPKTGKHEGPPYGYSIELGPQPAQVCPVCVDPRGARRNLWIESKPLDDCPRCSGPLETVMERRQKTKGGFALAKDRDAALVKEVQARNEGSYTEPSRLRVREFLVDEWLPAAKGSVKPSTYTSYSGHVYDHILPELGSILLRDLKTKHVADFYNKLAVKEGGRGGQCLSAKTRRNVHITLRRALGYAVDQEPPYIPRNPAAKVAKPKPDKPALHTWNKDQLRRFLDFVADDPLAALWRLYASTGMRRGEALALKWSDIDLSNGRVSIERSVVSVGYELQVSTPKTKKSERSVTLDPWTLKALKQLRAAQTLAWGAVPKADAWVFRGEDGEALHPDKVTARFQVLQANLLAEIVKHHEEAGNKGTPPVLPRVRLHDLRHTFATLALEAGVHVKVVSEQLGHATVAITLDTYSSVTPQMQEDASARVAALFSA